MAKYTKQDAERIRQELEDAVKLARGTIESASENAWLDEICEHLLKAKAIVVTTVRL